MSAQNRAQGSGPAPAEGLDLTAATQAVLDEMGWTDDRGDPTAYPHPGAIWELAGEVARAATPHVLRAAADGVEALGLTGMREWDAGYRAALANLRALVEEIAGGGK